MITAKAEALALDEDLQQLKALQENRVWKNHILPEIARMKREARSGMKDRKLPAAERCEHVTAHDQAEQLEEFLGKMEKRLREKLREYDESAPIIERRWGPLGPE